MKIWHNSLKERFIEFPVHQHLLMICNELNRAGNLLNDTQEYKNCLERALELLDYSVFLVSGWENIKRYCVPGD